MSKDDLKLRFLKFLAFIVIVWLIVNLIASNVWGQTVIYLPVIIVRAPSVAYVVDGQGVELFPDATPPFQYNWWDFRPIVTNHTSHVVNVTYTCGAYDASGQPLGGQIDDTVYFLQPGQTFTRALRFHFNHTLPSPADHFRCVLKNWAKLGG